MRRGAMKGVSPGAAAEGSGRDGPGPLGVRPRGNRCSRPAFDRLSYVGEQTIPKPSDPDGDDHPDLKVFLYRANGHDEEIDLESVKSTTFDEAYVLWIDLGVRDAAAISEIAEVLDLVGASTSDLRDPRPRLRLDNYGRYLQFSLFAAPITLLHTQREDPESSGQGSDDDAGTTDRLSPAPRLDLLVGPGWLLTVHERGLQFLNGFRGQDKADTRIGALGAHALAASLIDWHLEGYFEEVGRIETMIERLDERVLRDPTSNALLPRMLALRRRIARLRRLLVAQRPVLYGLGRPDLTIVDQGKAAGHYDVLASRFDRAVDELEHTRELVLGSFDLLTSRMSQQTNDLVKTLTFFTVIIGSAAAIAGLFGMNFDPPFFRTGAIGFFAVCGGLLAVGAAAWALARRKRWV